MKDKKNNQQKEYEASVDQLINYVTTHKDDINTQRIVANVLRDKDIGLTKEDISEFKARVGNLDKGQLQNLLGMLEQADYTLDSDVTSKNETEYPQ